MFVCTNVDVSCDILCKKMSRFAQILHVFFCHKIKFAYMLLCFDHGGRCIHVFYLKDKVVLSTNLSVYFLASLSYLGLSGLCPFDAMRIDVNL